MKLTRDKLKQIIKEELEEIMSEQPQVQQPATEMSPEVQLKVLKERLMALAKRIEADYIQNPKNLDFAQALTGIVRDLNVLAQKPQVVTYKQHMK